MGRHFFPAEARVPADRVRELLSEAETLVGNLRTIDSQALELLYMIDQIEEGIEALEAAGMDARPERVRLETVKRQLASNKRRFVSTVGSLLPQARGERQPSEEQWWWFLDQALTEERRQRWRRILISVGVGAAVLLILGLLYEFVLAPPREQRDAYGYMIAGENLVREAAALEGQAQALAEEGQTAEAEQKRAAADDMFQEALDKFQLAVALYPDDPEYWIWMGVMRTKLDLPDAAETFTTAQEIYRSQTGSDSYFFLTRAQAYTAIQNTDAAKADVERAIQADPENGQGYLVRSVIYETEGNYQAAIADAQQAAELARASGDVALEAQARYRQAILFQLAPVAPQGEDE